MALRATAGAKEGNAAGAARRVRFKDLGLPLSAAASDQELLEQVVAYYHQSLLQSPKALAYLERQGIASHELIDLHRLGLADRTLGLRLPPMQLKGGAEIRTRLQSIGILRASGHEHLNGCLVVPMFNQACQACQVYGHRITKGVKGPKDVWLAGSQPSLWNKRGLEGQTEVIVTHSPLDAMAFWCAGYRNVIATRLGQDGWDADLVAALENCRVRRVLVAFGSDEPEHGIERTIAEQLMAQGIECCRIHFPISMGAHEYALMFKPATKSLGLLIRKATWLGKGRPPAQKPVLDDVVGVVADADAAAAEVASVGKTDGAASHSVEEPKPSHSVNVAPAPCAWPVVTPASEPAVQVSEDEVVVNLAERRWRVRGLAKNLSCSTLKVNVLVTKGAAYHVDNFDLYFARARMQFIAQAAKELAMREDIIKMDLGRVLLKLESVQDARITAAMKVEPNLPKMSEAQAAQALALLKRPDLMVRIVADFDACGLVGESSNKLMAYVAATSRKLASPLAIVVQSSSAAGKSALMDAVLAFMPQEDQAKYSAMTGQSLYYMGQDMLQHKILAIAEEEGASRASYALKLLQSEGELSIASTGKDPATGKLVTQQHHVQGPVMIFLTTTAIEIDEELLNRCIVLGVDEGREQTRAIHQLQRAKRTLASLKAAQERSDLIGLHQNAQRLLRPLVVVNAYAEQLTFLSDTTRTRRDHEKYLTLIDAIALLHQHQRPIRSMPGDPPLQYIEVMPRDIAKANALAHEVLGRSLDDLPPQTRRLLMLIDAMVKQVAQEQQLPVAAVRFGRRTVRAATGWSDFQVKTHMRRLTELEYLLTHRGGRGHSFEYELLYDGDGSVAPRMAGLLDASELDNQQYDNRKELEKGSLEPPSRPQGGAKSVPGSVDQMPAEPTLARPCEPCHCQEPQIGSQSGQYEAQSYPRLSRRPGQENPR